MDHSAGRVNFVSKKVVLLDLCIAAVHFYLLTPRLYLHFSLAFLQVKLGTRSVLDGFDFLNGHQLLLSHFAHSETGVLLGFKA